jgi:hypothetical protein
VEKMAEITNWILSISRQGIYAEKFTVELRDRTGECMSGKLKEQLYQFMPERGYPLYIYFQDATLETQTQTLIRTMGFHICAPELSHINKVKEARILKITKASPKIAQQLLAYGSYQFGVSEEIIENFGYYETHVVPKLSLMVLSQSSFIWEVAFVQAESISEYIEYSDNFMHNLARFITSALVFCSVVSFKGKILDHNLVLSSFKSLKHEIIFYDSRKKTFFSLEKRDQYTVSDIHLSQKDFMQTISPEVVFSFLVYRSYYFSSSQIPKSNVVEMLQYLSQHLKISPPELLNPPLLVA